MIRKWAAALQPYYEKYRELFWYLVIGVLTTVVNWVVYYALRAVLPLHYLVINVIAWVAAVVFAFFPNRSLVFQAERHGGILCQFGAFVSSRIVTFLIEEALLYITVDFAHLPDRMMKIVVAVIVVILNYVFSKWIVFRKKK